MRLFIAIQLSEEMRDEICELQERFRGQGIKGVFTKRENLHLTLAFIGEYADPDRVLEVIESIPMWPFDLRLDGISAFGDLWWAGVEESEPLLRYVRALRHGLADAGIPFDGKRFKPHITVVRRAVIARQPASGIAPQGTMRVERASLMRSDRGKGGMVYTELC